MSLLDVVNWLAKAWEDVKYEVIVKSLASVDCSEGNESGDEFEDEDVPLSVLVCELQYNITDFEELDKNVPIENDTSDWDINDFFISKGRIKYVKKENNDESDSEIECTLSGSNISYLDVMQEHFCCDTELY